MQKVCRILRVLSTPQPLRLTDISVASGLSKATVLRLLAGLRDEGFVERDMLTRRYCLGDDALLLGVAMQGREHVRKWARPWLVRLAGVSGDTALLSIRSGVEAVCVDREFGSYPIRANYLDVGSRRPLGVGAGSLALLAWLSEEEVAAILEQVVPMLPQRCPGMDRSRLKSEIAHARARGYTLLLDVVVERMGGVGVPVYGSDGKPVAALSVASLSERLTPGRLEVVVPALQRAAAAIASRYFQHHQEGMLTRGVE